jgi:hypothetical protein
MTKEERKAYNKAYHEANKESIHAKQAAYYDANKDKINTQHKAYREATKEQQKEHSKAYYDANKDKIKVRQKAYRETNPDKVKAYDLKRLYGLSLDDYKELTASGCEVCGSFDRLCVDHNHTSGKVRGCLCSKCNQALGLLKEDTNSIKQLLKYMEKHHA